MLKKTARKYVPITPVNPKAKPSDTFHVQILGAKFDRDKLPRNEFQQVKENIMKVLQPTKLKVGMLKGGVVLRF